MALDINYLWNEKSERLSDKVRGLARGDDDLYQEGLFRNPYATDAYLVNAAKWAISHYKNKGVSMDNGPKWQYTKKLADGTVKKYRKDTLPIHIDKLTEEFELEFPDSSYAPDVLAIDKVCAERFYNSLDRKEAKFIDACVGTMSNYFYNSEARRKLKISRNEYDKIKRSTYEKFISAFGTDEDVRTLYQNTQPTNDMYR